MQKKVLVGMSGGVDSSVTANLLKEQGYEVEGVSLILFDPQSRKALGKAPCCSVEAVADAAKTANAIGIRHSHIDVRDLFSEKVIRPFIEAYSKGLTPNPCILCNQFVKFPSLISVADKRGCEFIATGHYARVQRTGTRARLLRGLDPKKDQSYVLYALCTDIIGRLILPLGEKTKQTVREIAHKLSLPSANRPESQEICFIEERNYADFMDGLAEKVNGPIIDITTGKQIGSHGGIHLYTIGQRKRLPAMGKPVYVVKIKPSANAIYVGPREMAQMKAFTVHDTKWLVDPHKLHLRATVKVRSTMKDELASLQIIDHGTVRIDYSEPQWAPSPGQSAVFYDSDTVLGGGVIAPF
ncbi:MAG: tRNA 2-thiouridine(34) synthase MnmA [Dissulfurispiraceae bacterium]|jgi:tRNA-uridine 2-sulfurtransferase